MSHKIKIEWLTDSHDCETCGTSWADGANVWIDGVLTLQLTPFASCFNETHYGVDDVYRRIIERLGHTLEDGNG